MLALRTADAKRTVYQALTVGCTTCVYSDPAAGHSWIYCESTVGTIHGRGSEDAGERCVNASHDITCSAGMHGVNGLAHLTSLNHVIF